MSEDTQTTPVGDNKQAEGYIVQLTELIDSDKLEIVNTDLSQFDPSAIQDHYRTELKDYQVEVSHSKNPDNGQDSYVILFNNLKQIKEGCSEKTILAYMYLSEDQFLRFKNSAQKALERKKKAEEEKRLKEVLSPIDQALENLKINATPQAEIETKALTDDVVVTPLAETEPAEEKEEVVASPQSTLNP